MIHAFRSDTSITNFNFRKKQEITQKNNLGMIAVVSVECVGGSDALEPSTLVVSDSNGKFLARFDTPKLSEKICQRFELPSNSIFVSLYSDRLQVPVVKKFNLEWTDELICKECHFGDSTQIR